MRRNNINICNLVIIEPVPSVYICIRTMRNHHSLLILIYCRQSLFRTRCHDRLNQNINKKWRIYNTWITWLLIVPPCTHNIWLRNITTMHHTHTNHVHHKKNRSISHACAHKDARTNTIRTCMHTCIHACIRICIYTH